MTAAATEICCCEAWLWIGGRATKGIGNVKITVFGGSKRLGKRLDRTIFRSRSSLGRGHFADRYAAGGGGRSSLGEASSQV
jgi:hypothetical protein